MTLYSTEEAAHRAGVDPEYVVRLIGAGILGPRDKVRLSAGDVRRVMLVKSLDDAGMPVDGIAAAIASGATSLDFMDAPAFERYAALSSETFGAVCELLSGRCPPIQLIGWPPSSRRTVR